MEFKEFNTKTLSSNIASYCTLPEISIYEKEYIFIPCAGFLPVLLLLRVLAPWSRDGLGSRLLARELDRDADRELKETNN